MVMNPKRLVGDELRDHGARRGLLAWETEPERAGPAQSPPLPVMNCGGCPDEKLEELEQVIVPGQHDFTLGGNERGAEYIGDITDCSAAVAGEGDSADCSGCSRSRASDDG